MPRGQTYQSICYFNDVSTAVVVYNYNLDKQAAINKFEVFNMLG